MKKEWKNPMLEVLDINMTMAGPGLKYPDARMMMLIQKKQITIANCMVF